MAHDAEGCGLLHNYEAFLVSQCAYFAAGYLMLNAYSQGWRGVRVTYDCNRSMVLHGTESRYVG
jgi:hypothetical protein